MTAAKEGLKMAAVNSTPSKAAGRTRTTRQTKAREPLALYAAGAGVLSFRNSLKTRELGIIDKALAIIERCLIEPKTVFESPDAVEDYFRLSLGGEKREIFGVAFLDVQHRLIAFEHMFIGSLTQTSVYPREVALAAMRHCAAAVLLVHNHPSGNVQPSKADEQLTQTLKHALSMIDIRVLDHIIVSAKSAFSMAKHGLL